MERFSQKENVVRRPAAASRLELDKRDPVGIILAAGKRVELLPDGAGCGVAHIVMQVFKPRGNHGRTFVVQNLDMIAVQGENLLQKLHVGGENVGRENGEIALHLFGEINCHGVTPFV